MVVVAHYNTSALDAAISALKGEYALLIVDNGVDEEVRELALRHKAEYLTPGFNVGFAAAVNIALARRDGRNVLLLNPDARISPDAVYGLITSLQADSGLCAVAPRLLDEAGRAQCVEWPVPSPREELVKALRLQRFIPPRATFLAGAVLLLSDEALDRHRSLR